MINNKKIVVVLPVFNAEMTLEKTFQKIPFDIVDEVILVDDYSSDKTLKKAEKIGIKQNNRPKSKNRKKYDRIIFKD